MGQIAKQILKAPGTLDHKCYFVYLAIELTFKFLSMFYSVLFSDPCNIKMYVFSNFTCQSILPFLCLIFIAKMPR